MRVSELSKLVNELSLPSQTIFLPSPGFSMTLITAPTLLALLLLTLYVAARAYLIPHPIPGIPYSRSAYLMPWGALFSLGLYNFRTGEVFRWFSLQCLLHKSHLVQLFIPSFSTTRPTLVLADLREIEHMATRRLGEVDRADNMHRWFGVLIPQSTVGMKTKERAFREQRRLWNAMHSPEFLARIAAERLHEAALTLVQLWERKAALAGERGAFNAQEDVRMATLDGIWSMSLGSRLGLLDTKINGKEFRIVKMRSDGSVVFGDVEMPPFYATFGRLLMCMDWVMQGISAPLYTWFFTKTGILGRAMEKKDKMLDVCIAASRDRLARNSSAEVTCALDGVLQKDRSLHKQSSSPYAPSHAASDAVLRDEILELLITGHETTASTILWSLKYLTDSPSAQHQLRTALFAALPPSDSSPIPSAQDIINAKIPYLDAVIAESLRLSATGPVSFRQTLVECEILGHMVPAGTPIILATHGPSYEDPSMPMLDDARRAERVIKTMTSSSMPKSDADSKLTPESAPLDRFDPSRWLTSTSPPTFDPSAVYMLPFSAGTRGCFGKKVALLELRIMLAVLVLAFEFPRLERGLSGYAARDGLTRRPVWCFVRPRKVAAS